MLNQILQGDCLELMPQVAENSVDLILCDLPYGTTKVSWDTVIPFESLWDNYWRVLKPNGTIVLTSAQPFTTALISSQLAHFRYCWYWVKSYSVGFINAHRMPMKNVEDICVFFKQRGNYNPQGLKPFEKTFKNSKSKSEYAEESGKATHNGGRLAPTHTQHFTNYPTQTLTFKRERTTHPTQKPVALFEYLIRTYTNEGDTVLDNCSGSGTTAIACLNSNRNFICMEMNPTIHAQSVQRLNTHTPKML